VCLLSCQPSLSCRQPTHPRYNHSGVTALRFEADWSGLVHLDKAECIVEIEVRRLRWDVAALL
jgi:hypothetical protein